MNSNFQDFVDWAGGIHEAAKQLDCSESLVRHILSGRRAISKATADQIHRVSDGKFDRAAMLFGDASAA